MRWAILMTDNLPPAADPLLIAELGIELEFWSNEHGIVQIEQADLFGPEEREVYNLPIGGEWYMVI